MEPRIQLLFDSLERDRSELSEKILRLSPEQFNAAQPGKWSVHQILAHLIAGERMTREYMEKKILGIRDAETSGFTERIKMALLILSQRLPLKFRAPRAVVTATSSYSTAEELGRAWSAERTRLREFLDPLDAPQLQKKIYRHIRAGRLNVFQGIAFLREHFHHHRPQINRLLPKR